MKKKLIKALILEKDSSCFRTNYQLLMALLEDARERNDHAPIDEVPKIQGEIRLIKYLLKELNPIRPERIHYDGGFGG